MIESSLSNGKQYYDIDFGEFGTIRGYLNPELPEAVVMRGVPFMKPPVNDLRWKAPVIERSSEGYTRAQKINGERIYLAEDAVPSCPNAFNDKPDITEDCTYLDIFVPRKAIENEEKLKIFLYFHGGAFLGEANKVISPNKGSIIALEQNIVVVSANYRLGAFGFLFSNLLDDQIDKEHGLEYYDGQVTSGNQGLMDQQMAMIWTGKFSKVPIHLKSGTHGNY